MIFEPSDEGIVVKLDKSEFLEIVNEYIKENESDFKKFTEVGC